MGEQNGRKPKAVLIVDDEFVVALGISRLLDWNSFGYEQVILCQSVEEAMEKAHESLPYLIVTDICMDGTRGLDLIRSLLQENICNHFIIISGYAEFEFAQKAMALGVRHYLLKPVNRLKLEQAVREISGEMKPELSKRTVPANIPLPHKIEQHDKFLTYIRVNYQKNISIASMAEYLHINASYAGQLFHNVVGKTFSEYLNEFRVEQAKQLILHSTYSMSEISSKVGYVNLAYFFKSFRRITGMTPSEFRERYDKNVECLHLQ